jgi:tripartite-type tricarboxylate transporter receptor subunit TctC
MTILRGRAFAACLHAGLCLICVLLSTSSPAHAEGYPSRPVRLIVATSPGGNLDLTARLLAKYFQKYLGEPFIVENRTGADGMIAMREVQRAAPDGYVIGIMSSGPTIAQPIMKRDTGYSYRDFTPIGLVSETPLVFVVPAKSPFKSMAQFVEYAKQHPGKLNYGSAGVGGTNHICYEVFKQMAGIDVVHVPYRGSAPVIQDLIGGHLDMSLEQITGAHEQIRSGLLRPLAVSMPQRIPQLPDVPTVKELGYGNYDENTWLGLGAPKGLPTDVRQRLESVLSKTESDPEYQQQLAGMGAISVNMIGASYGEFLQKQNQQFEMRAARLGLREE